MPLACPYVARIDKIKREPSGLPFIFVHIPKILSYHDKLGED